MVSALLVRGMLVGIVAGLLAFGFAKLVGEPQVDRAIAFESQTDNMGMDMTGGAHPDMDHAELVSRDVQSGLGLFTGIVIYGTAFGGLFALMFACAQGRIGRIGPRGLAALLAAAGFVAVALIPDLKYPANPPSVGSADTIGYRTELFFLMLAISITAMALAIGFGRRLAARYGLWNAALVTGAAFITVIALAQILLPDINEVPAEFPAVVLWQFRIAALGIQLVLWTTLGLLFGWLTERSSRSRFRA